MLDNFREQATSSPYFQEEEPIVEQAPIDMPSKRTIDQITGMNAKQRFIISVMLFIVVALLGFMILLVAGRIIFF